MVSDDDIRQITAAVWQATLDLPLDETPVGFDDGVRLTGCVVISGGWHGAVTLVASEPLAQRAAARMFDVAEADLDADEVRDALGELTNMTGGNIKTLLGGESQLSIPSVTWGREYGVFVPGASVVNSVELACGGEPLRVTVLERQVG